jgi:hypothetical protein
MSKAEHGLDDPGIPLDPVVAVAGNQLHAIGVAFDAQPIAIIFDLVEPVRGRWNFGAASGDTKMKSL